MIPEIDIEVLKDFIRSKLPALANLGVIGDNLAAGVEELLQDQEDNPYESIAPLLSIAKVWQHHWDYGCWVK